MQSDPTLGRRLSHDGAVEGYRSWMVRWPDQVAVVVVLGDEATNATRIGRALERALYPKFEGAQQPSEDDVSFVPTLLEKTDDGWRIDHHYEWRWVSAEQPGRELHCFAPYPQGPDTPGVSLALNVSLKHGRQLSRELHQAADRMDEMEDSVLSSHVVYDGEAIPGEYWLEVVYVRPYVTESEQGATVLHFGFHNILGKGLEMEISLRALRRYLGALDSALDELE